jgi:hypothetical protein
MRGRLISPFLAELHRLDTRAMATSGDSSGDPAGAGQLTGYDPDFKEPVLIERDDGTAERTRQEHAAVRIPCQVESKVFDELRMLSAGNTPRSRIDLVLHFKDLERMGLVDDATGDALIRPGDRLGALYDTAGALVQAIRTPPGLYVTEARPMSFGPNLRRPRRNLLLLILHDRRQAAGRTA